MQDLRKRTPSASIAHSFTDRQRQLTEQRELIETTSSTALYNLPMELLDIILQKSYLYWILNLRTKQRDNDVCRCLISVDVCFNRRITKQRFKKKIWRYLKDFYGKSKKVSAIIKNNAEFLLQNIQPNDVLLALLLSVSCITKAQSHVILRLHSKRTKNQELLWIVRSMNKFKCSDFIRCLRRTNQDIVAKILEIGGVVINIQAQFRDVKSIASVEAQQQLHLTIEGLRNRSKRRSHQIDILISQLKEECVEILNSQLDRQTVIVWIWCRTQSSLKHIQSLYESNQLKEKLSAITDAFLSTTIAIEQNQFKKTVAFGETLLYALPLEVLDTILQKSYLHWILNLTTKPRDEDVTRCLISVDVCFHRRITRQRFKKAIWRHLEDFYKKAKKRNAIIRNNRNYLLENIQPTDEFIASLLSINCITQEQSHFIQRMRSTGEKNDELLHLVTYLDDTKFSHFVKCLRNTNQKMAARIIENGGGVIKLRLKANVSKCKASMETLELLHRKIEDLRNRDKPRSYKTDKLISQLKEEGIEILNSQLDRQTVIVWIWCQTQSAIEYIQRMYESNQLRDVIFKTILPSISTIIDIDLIQFKKTIVVRPISINFTQKIELPRSELAWGLTKLRNDIYALCRVFGRSSPCVIRVFEDRSPFSLQEIIEIKEIKESEDMASNDQDNCLYVSDSEEKCVWKITREEDNEHKIIKWLNTDYKPRTLSVSSDGQLLVVSYLSSILRIYASDAELIRSIQLPRDIDYVIHARETSIGNLIAIHNWTEVKEGESGSSGREKVTKVVSEFTIDGQMVIRRCTPPIEAHALIDLFYISLDSNDQVILTDRNNARVILLDSILKFSRILCPTKEETEETMLRIPYRVYYDEGTKQLIVGAAFGGVNVYTLSRD